MQKSPERIFAIGDIHGCAQELELLIEQLAVTPRDLVVFLGDYVDRGPDSRRVIDLVLELSQRTEVVALKGNHEALFLDFLEHPETVGSGLFVLNGGTSTLANYMVSDGSIEIPDAHVRFLKTLKVFHETEHYFFVHAGVPDQPLSTLNAVDHAYAMMWSRFPFLNSRYAWEKLVVHGHTPVHEVQIFPNRVNLDTGCVYDGRLTAMELPSKRLIQVEKGVKGEPVHYSKELDSARISTRYTGRLAVQAGRPGDTLRRYETLNYNQFGFLMKSAEEVIGDEFENDDEIEGKIGSDPASLLDFTGKIVRKDSRGPFTVYGVRIEKISSDDTTGGKGGKSGWMKRPEDPSEK